MDSPSRKLGFITLGCRLNQSESDALIGKFIQQGFSLAEDDTDPLHVCVLNTCAVTARGEQKSRQALARIRKRHPGALIIVTGCAAEHDQAQFPQLENVIFVDTDRKHAIMEIAERALAEQGQEKLRAGIAPAGIAPDRSDFAPMGIAPDRFAFAPAAKSLHTRAALKIEDGCDNRCSYCIVPALRGKAQSRPFAECVDAACELIALGYHEIVVTGVNIQQYRDPASGKGLEPLVRALLALEGEYRLRLSSIEPEEATESLAGLFRHERLSPHLHLCLQSGADRVLALMRRKYRTSDFTALCCALRETRPLFNLTADIIVGFPGESDQDFADTLALVRACGFTHAHIFPFSPRAGCDAAELPDRPSKETVSERIMELRRLVHEIRYTFLQSLIGKEERVLVEKIHADGSAGGYGRLYIPIRVQATNGRSMGVNDFVDCIVTEVEHEGRGGLIALPRCEGRSQ